MRVVMRTLLPCLFLFMDIFFTIITILAINSKVNHMEPTTATITILGGELNRQKFITPQSVCTRIGIFDKEFIM